MDNFSNKLERLEQGVSISFEELFNDTFVQTHTNFNNVQEILEQSNFTQDKIDNEENIEELNSFISTHTNFSNWQEFEDSAFDEYLDATIFG